MIDTSMFKVKTLYFYLQYSFIVVLGLTYCTLTLLSTVVFLLVATHMNGWKLDRKFGAVLMLWYLIFIAIASLYEMNGTMNPPSCLTDY